MDGWNHLRESQDAEMRRYRTPRIYRVAGLLTIEYVWRNVYHVLQRRRRNGVD